MKPFLLNIYWAGGSYSLLPTEELFLTFFFSLSSTRERLQARRVFNFVGLLNKEVWVFLEL